MGGATDPRAEVIERHLPLVRSIATRYAHRGEPFEDLVQVGTVGLIKAVDRYDPARHPDLAALARPSIEGEIRHHLRNGGAVHVPRTDRELAARLRAIRDELAAGGRREPTLAEVAAAARVDEARAARALQSVAARRAVPLPEAGAAEAPAARTESEAAEARVLLDAGWPMLDPRERRLLELRYREDRSQSQIAREMGLSQAHVSRLLRAALEHLRAVVDPPPLEAGDASAATPSEPITVTRRRRGDAPERSGRLLLRLPRSLHGELAAAADREGVALNTFIAGKLAAAIGWHEGEGRGGADGAADGGSRGASSGDALRAGPASPWLVLNAIAIAVAALAGVALLLVALLP